MSSSYPGVPANAVAQANTVTLTVMGDGDPLNAANLNPAPKLLADWMQRVWNLVGDLFTAAKSYAGLQTFNGGIALPAPAPISVSSFGSTWNTGLSGGTGPGTVAYWKDFMGQVHVEGQLHTSDSVSPSGSAFTLPVGYRPAQTLYIPGTEHSGYAAVGAGVAILVETNGNVTPIPSGNNSTPLYAIYTLNLDFRAA